MRCSTLLILVGFLAGCGGEEEPPPTIAKDPAVLNSQGWSQHQSGDFDGAIETYTEAIKIDPNVQILWINRGLAKAGKGDLGGAVVDLSRAIQIDPTTGSAW